MKATVIQEAGIRSAALHTRDLEGARHFYASVLRCAPHELDSHGMRFEDAVDEDPPHWTVCVASSDMTAVERNLREVGAAFETTAAATGRRFRVTDTVGLDFDVVENRHRIDTDMAEGDIVLADVYTTEVDDAVHFYSRALGMAVDVLPDDPVDYTRLSVNGRHVAGALDLATFLPSSSPNQWMPYLFFRSIDRAIERSTASGAWVIVPSTSSPTGRYAVLRDPHGGLFGVWDGGPLSSSGPSTPSDQHR